MVHLVNEEEKPHHVTSTMANTFYKKYKQHTWHHLVNGDEDMWKTKSLFLNIGTLRVRGKNTCPHTHRQWDGCTHLNNHRMHLDNGTPKNNNEQPKKTHNGSPRQWR